MTAGAFCLCHGTTNCRRVLDGAFIWRSKHLEQIDCVWLAMADFWLRQIKTMTDEGDAVKLEIVDV